MGSLLAEHDSNICRLSMTALSFVCLDMGDTDSLLAEYDTTLSKNVMSSNLFGLLDASSLLWRLNVMGVEVGEKRWAKVSDAVAQHAHNHRSPWLV